MSSNVFPLKPARSACHVPESARPAPARAVQVPCQCGTVSLAGAFTLRADHVPSRTMRLESSRSVHEPAGGLRRFDFSPPPSAESSARAGGRAPHSSQHRARLLRQRTGNKQELKTRTRRFIGTGIVPRILIRKRRRAFPRICHSEGALCPRFASRAGGQSSCLLVWDRFSTLALSSTMLCYFVSHAGSLACSLQFCGYLLVARIPVTRLWAL